MYNTSIQPLLEYMSKHIDLNTNEQELLTKSVKIRKYLKGQYVVQQGDVCRYESFVVEGCLRTFHVDKQGNEHLVMFAIENWWTADLGSFISQTEADYNVQCIENSVLIQFSYEILEDLYKRIPKLERFFRIIIKRALVASEKRIVRNLSLTAMERYQQFKSQYPQIEQRVPQYMIASYLGITKEFLSKIRSQLIKTQ